MNMPKEKCTGLDKLKSGSLKPWKLQEIDSLMYIDKTKRIPIYVGHQNEDCLIPTKKQIEGAMGGRITKGLAQLLYLDILLEVTIPELADSFNIERNRGNWKYVLPGNLKWLGKYLKGNYMDLQRRSSNTRSLSEKKENFSSPIYERHYISNVLNEQGVPYYGPLHIKVKDK
jgi:hypothetical protein